MDSKAECDQHT